MVDRILLYLGAALPLFWGVAHLFPTRSVVRDFGGISLDNQRIITMEWIIERGCISYFHRGYRCFCDVYRPYQCDFESHLLDLLYDAEHAISDFSDDRIQGQFSVVQALSNDFLYLIHSDTAGELCLVLGTRG